MKTALSLHVTASRDAKLETVAAELVACADRTGLTVKATIGDRTMIAAPESDAAAVLSAFNRLLQPLGGAFVSTFPASQGEVIEVEGDYTISGFAIPPR